MKFLSPTFQRINKYEYVIAGLKLGFMRVDPNAFEIVDDWSKEGRFYPYEANRIGFDKLEKIWVYQLVEWQGKLP